MNISNYFEYAFSKRQRKYKFAVILAILTLGFNVGCLDQSRMREYSENESGSVIVDDVANNSFLAQVIRDDKYDVNSGLTIEKIETLNQSGPATSFENYYPVLILNHSSEAVKFADVGFNVQIFEYFPNSEDVIWKKFNLPYYPEKTEKTLPPKLEEFDFQLVNSWEFFKDRDFVDIKSEIIRIYISGIGVESGVYYCAFIDFRIK